MSQDLCLDQIQEFQTRGDNILDLVFTNRPDIAKSPQLLAGLCDHDAVSHKISLQPFRKKPTKREIWLWNKVDPDKIISDTYSFHSKFFKSFCVECNVIDMWNFVKSEVEVMISNNVPKKVTSAKQHQPWINTKTKRLIRKKQRWFTKSIIEPINYSERCES